MSMKANLAKVYYIFVEYVLSDGVYIFLGIFYDK
jgi:hypothetical protein